MKKLFLVMFVIFFIFGQSIYSIEKVPEQDLKKSLQLLSEGEQNNSAVAWKAGAELLNKIFTKNKVFVTDEHCTFQRSPFENVPYLYLDCGQEGVNIILIFPEYVRENREEIPSPWLRKLGQFKESEKIPGSFRVTSPPGKPAVHPKTSGYIDVQIELVSLGETTESESSVVLDPDEVLRRLEKGEEVSRQEMIQAIKILKAQTRIR
jgi:hypothetical protein